MGDAVSLELEELVVADVLEMVGWHEFMESLELLVV
jgi:hypothetical protein